jgi:hypothetical protein
LRPKHVTRTKKSQQQNKPSPRFRLPVTTIHSVSDIADCGRNVAWVARAMSLLNGTCWLLFRTRARKSGEASPCQPSWYTLPAINPNTRHVIVTVAGGLTVHQIGNKDQSTRRRKIPASQEVCGPQIDKS